MRNPNRIEPFCNKLAEAWKKNLPDWRFGQLIYGIFGEIHTLCGDIKDPFFLEEDEMIMFIEKIIKRLSKCYGTTVLDEARINTVGDDGKYRDLKDVLEDIDRIYSASDKTDVTERH